MRHQRFEPELPLWDGFLASDAAGSLVVDRLENAEKWEQGFIKGLLGAAIFVPVLSRDAIARFRDLENESNADNVLLEWRIALELERRGLLSCVRQRGRHTLSDE